MTPGLAYPLSHAVEYQPGVHHEGQHCSNFYQAPPAGPFAIKPPFGSHFVCIERGSY